jgi:hypothetical protein
MGRRFLSRKSNGRFRRATLENTFGLKVLVCPVCRTMQPHEVGTEPPTHCHRLECQAPLQPEAEARHG